MQYYAVFMILILWVWFWFFWVWFSWVWFWFFEYVNPFVRLDSVSFGMWNWVFQKLTGKTNISKSRDAMRLRHKESTTFSNGCLGSRIDEERSEMWYVMRIAKLCESLKFWTHIALAGFFLGACMSECQQTPLSAFACKGCWILALVYENKHCA